MLSFKIFFENKQLEFEFPKEKNRQKEEQLEFSFKNKPYRKFPQHYQKVIELVKQGKKLREIAAELGIPLGTVGMIAYQYRQAFPSLLQKRRPGVPDSGNTVRIIMLYRQGKKIEDIGKELGLSPNTVTVVLHRARKKGFINPALKRPPGRKPKQPI